jgi:hypothetical protein
MKKDFFELPVGDIYPCSAEVTSNKNKVFFACVDEKAEEAAEAAAELVWKNEQMEAHFEELDKESSMIIVIDNIVWVKEPALVNNLPADVALSIKIDDFENNEDNLEEYLFFVLSETYVFTPISIGGYKVLG